MGLRPFLRALRRRWVALLIAVVIGLAAGVAAFVVVPQRWTSTVTFYVATTAASSGAVDTGQFAQNRVASYGAILTSERVAQLVSRRSGVPVDSVRGHLASTYNQNTVLVTGIATAADAATAQRMATALVEVFPGLVEGLDNQNKNGVGVDVALVSGPQSSTGPVFPVLWQFGLGGLFLGLVVGVVVALVQQARRPTMVGVAETETSTGLPVLATVPEDPVVQSGTWQPAPASARAEAYRQLRAQVLAQRVGSADEAGLVVAVVSATAAEGRTQVALGLADAVAETGARVVLVDADLDRAALAQLTGAPTEPGLVELLGAARTLEPVGAHAVAHDEGSQPPVRDLEGSPLKLVTAGARTERAGDLLAGEAFGAVLADLRRSYQVIVIDTAPLTTADGLSAAGRADFAVAVVAEDRTRRDVALAALRTAGTAGVRVLGVVVNRHRAGRTELRRYERSVAGAARR
ncbi:Mrp family chromosome partitioning ATPase [Friedmanniella endophytica]|uniref:Mrp family chromosome partitioning ATPase n=1 Tax=Microlunatus kandeliicorticis TaxID=1759536 RepID=A0A7W3P4A5_9ACTN|nr:polysaccharide biosynthesis tyrosine autokinase [Microlunatus kandeliicorticis]MBA8792676.1 Mrp family chromosome partitioning ATPase [Microlunatus kandeliicorticis]